MIALAYLCLGVAFALTLRPRSTAPDHVGLHTVHAFAVMVLVWPLAAVVYPASRFGPTASLAHGCRRAVAWLGATWEVPDV